MSDFFLRSPHLKKRKKIRSEEEDDNDEFIFGNHLQGDDDDVENDISQIEVEEDFESNNQEQIEDDEINIDSEDEKNLQSVNFIDLNSFFTNLNATAYVGLYF